MYCFQCEETANNKQCDIRGICGKSPEVANLQDLMIYVFKGVSFFLKELRQFNIKNEKAETEIIKGLFSTITNANFDEKFFIEKIKKGIEIRDELKAIYLKNVKDKKAIPFFADCKIDDFTKKAEEVGILKTVNPDIRSLRWTLIYALKGMSAYLYHALALGFKDDTIIEFIEDCLIETENERLKETDYLDLLLKSGEFGIKVMDLLDKANTSKYGHPHPRKINIGTRNKPGILISGHDLADLEELLIQTQNTGVDIYTHGEMLPANAYPYFRKYKNLVGNYGSSWWHQTDDFETFNGPIILTTNCLVPPRKSYKERLYTTGVVGYPDINTVPIKNKKKDFSKIIAQAKKCIPPKEIEKGSVDGGFAHNFVLNNADKIIDLVKRGKIKKFFVMAGCDGRHTERDYYTKFAKKLPKNTVILTAGCAKYRYNKLNLGDIEGIPRVIDAGQCNDSFSLLKIAQGLKDAFKLESVNDLPIVFNIAWYEQKAVLILMSLLHLGIKNITLGPRIPAFLSENVKQIIIDKFQLKNNTIVEEDMPKMLGKNTKGDIIINKAFYKISYGLYTIGTEYNGKSNALIANAVFQITSKPLTVAVSIAKENLTHDLIKNSRSFSISVLSKDAPMRFIGSLGFKSGRDGDKLELLKIKKGSSGSPIVLDNAVAYFDTKLKKSVDLTTHTLFIGEVIESNIYNNEKLLTYESYRKVKNGKSPEQCPVSIASESKKKKKGTIVRDMSRYECIPCGEIYDPEIGDPHSGIPPGTPFADLPDDWKCPICGVGKDEFVKLSNKKKK